MSFFFERNLITLFNLLKNKDLFKIICISIFSYISGNIYFFLLNLSNVSFYAEITFIILFIQNCFLYFYIKLYDFTFISFAKLISISGIGRYVDYLLYLLLLVQLSGLDQYAFNLSIIITSLIKIVVTYFLRTKH